MDKEPNDLHAEQNHGPRPNRHYENSRGVVRMEAAAAQLTTTKRWIFFTSIFFVSYALGLDFLVRNTYVPCGRRDPQPSVARLTDVFGRIEIFSVAVLLNMAGTIIETFSVNVQGFAGGAVLHQLGYTLSVLTIEIMIADFTSMKTRLFFACLFPFAFMVHGNYLFTLLVVSYNFTVEGATRVASLYSFCATVVGSVLGLVVIKIRRLKEVILVGIVLWFVGGGLIYHYRGGTGSKSGVIGGEIVIGTAAGFFSWPTYVLIQTTARHEYLSILISLIFTVNSIGQAFGNCVSGAIWTQTLFEELNKNLGPFNNATLAPAVYAAPLYVVPEYPIGTPERDAIVVSYRYIQRILTIVAICIVVPMFVLGLLVHNPQLSDRQTQPEVESGDLGDPKSVTAAVDLYESLFYLQHRGQDAAGISVCHGGHVYQRKDNGMAQKVFSQFSDGNSLIKNLPGWSEAQPFYINSPYGVSMSVNGNLINSDYLRKFLDTEARRHVNSESDSELLLNVFANSLQELGKIRINTEDIFTALRDVYAKCNGAFACTAMVTGFGVLGFRDANGIRPLCLGSRPSQTLKGAKDYFLASESVALKQLGFTDIYHLLPGEAVFLEKGGIVHHRQIVERRSYTPDAFEYVYFARPESLIDGISVHRSRQNMGVKLANKMRKVLGEQGIRDIDVVIPVPETSNTAAATLATRLGVEFSSAFVKNRYVFRTFILPGQDARKKGIRRKLSPIESEFKGKRVCIVDDSIVRGNTSREIVQMAREAGAIHVIVVSCSPAIRNPHIYGIDLADPTELVAYQRTTEEIAKHIGADTVIFQDLSDLTAACVEAAEGKSEIHDFEVGVFSGKYSTEVPEGYFEHLSNLRGNKEKGGLLIPNGNPEYSEDINMYNLAST
ncbi:Amidophosphoribosyltransferase [Neonectria ditissima]|uniref:amidophosphoribosyltransferase n=1 Tax=Neonectria ditissima TaxID=78410 RepID=A0A0P7AP51_9HYPO|nr:Amidophosphoribosyltransferase [Neonectria ditissima]